MSKKTKRRKKTRNKTIVEIKIIIKDLEKNSCIADSIHSDLV